MSQPSTGPAEPARSRYAEAFWRVVPVPALIAAGVGLALEVAVWRRFRRRWAGETTAHPMDVPPPLRTPVRVGVTLAVLVGAVAWKAVGLGESWVTGLAAGLGLVAFYLLVALVDRWIHG